MTSVPHHAVLLCAGLGSRLLPLTADRPKCLIAVAGRTILEHQVDALAAAGVARVTIVGGYRFDRLAAFVAERWPDAAARPALLFNPFFAVSNSIGSVWAARDRLAGAFCLLNGDTIYDPALVAAALAWRDGPVGLLVEAIGAPEPDEMRVRLDGARVVAVGKDVPASLARHRSLGFVVARDGGGYLRALKRTIAGASGVQRFHHAVIDRLARDAHVGGIVVAPGGWTEIDRPADIARRGGGAPSVVAGARATAS